MSTKIKLTKKDFINKKSVMTFVFFGLTMIFLFLLIYGVSGWTMYGAIDGTFASGATGIAISILSYVTNQGLFDVFYVGFENLISVSKKNGKKQYDMVSYRESKITQRKSNRFIFLSYLIVGVVFLVASLVLFYVGYPH